MNTFGDLTLSDLHELGWKLVLEPLSPGATLGPSIQDRVNGTSLDDLTAPLEEYFAEHGTVPEDVVGPTVADMKIRAAAEELEGIYAWRGERNSTNDVDRLEEIFLQGFCNFFESLDLAEADGPDPFGETVVGESPDNPKMVLAIANGEARLCYVLGTILVNDLDEDA